MVRNRRLLGVVFDFDGVFLPYWPRVHNKLRSMLTICGCPPAVTDMLELYREDLRKYLQVNDGPVAISNLLHRITKHDDSIPLPSNRALLHAWRKSERANAPFSLLPGSQRALDTIRTILHSEAKPGVIGMLSSRSYTTAMWHLGDRPKFVEQFDIMQFSNGQWYQRMREHWHIVRHNGSVPIIAGRHYKPDARVVRTILRWMGERGMAKQATSYVRAPDILVYVGDTVIDYRTVVNINRWLAQQNYSFRLLFVPVCSSVMQHKEWQNIIDVPQVVGRILPTVEHLPLLVRWWLEIPEALPRIP